MQEITVNIKLVIFGVIEDSLAVYVHESELPRAKINNDDPLDAQVEALFFRTIHETLEGKYSEQLYTISEAGEVTIVYFVLIPLEGDQMFEAGWKKVSELSKKSADYAILSYAVQRLQWKVEYTNVVYSLLPKEFTLSELQKTYEAIFGQILDKRNFRKKILSLSFVEPTGKRRVGVSRPAQVYRFKNRIPTFVKIFS